MRNKWILAYAVLLCVFFGGLIARTEQGLKTAETVYFRMVPADPRALLSGDYMELAYQFEREASSKGFRIWYGNKELTLYIGENGVAGEEETARPLTLRFRHGRFNLPHQFYFQEGGGAKYQNASYAKMSILPDGRLLLTGLTDENLNEI